MIYDIQKVEDGFIKTDLVSSSKRRIYARVQELIGRKQQCRVMDRAGRLLEPEEINAMR